MGSYLQCKLLVIPLLILLYSNVFSQSKWETPRLMIGANVINTVDNHHYKPKNIILQIPYLLREFASDNKLFLTIEPNYSLVRVNRRLENIYKWEHEYGTLFGLKQVYTFNRFKLITEPFFGFMTITDESEKQSSGFNFSIGYGIGFTHKIDRVELGMDARFRHISNAGLEQPNSGIDSILLYFGIEYKFN